MNNFTKAFNEMMDNLEKSNRTHLIRKQVTDKNGHRRTVWVKPDEHKIVKLNTKIEDKELPKNDINKLPSDFNNYSKETQQNIKDCKYSIVTATYLGEYGEKKTHKFGVCINSKNDMSVFEDAKDVVDRSIMYGMYGSWHVKKEVNSVQDVSAADFEKITGVKVGKMADGATQKDYTFKELSIDNDSNESARLDAEYMIV